MELPKKGGILTILKRLRTAATSLVRRIFKRSVSHAIAQKQLKSRELVIVTTATINLSNNTWGVEDTTSILYAGHYITALSNDAKASVLKGAPVVMATNCLMDCIVDFEEASNTRIYEAVKKEMGEIYVQCSPELNK
jgi:hypothetical protein